MEFPDTEIELRLTSGASLSGVSSSNGNVDTAAREPSGSGGEPADIALCMRNRPKVVGSGNHVCSPVDLVDTHSSLLLVVCLNAAKQGAAMSAKQRRQQKKLRQQQQSGKVVDPDDQDHTDQVTSQPVNEPATKDSNTVSNVSKRGQRAKAQKIKAKYAEQVKSFFPPLFFLGFPLPEAVLKRALNNSAHNITLIPSFSGQGRSRIGDVRFGIR